MLTRKAEARDLSWGGQEMEIILANALLLSYLSVASHGRRTGRQILSLVPVSASEVSTRRSASTPCPLQAAVPWTLHFRGMSHCRAHPGLEKGRGPTSSVSLAFQFTFKQFEKDPAAAVLSGWLPLINYTNITSSRNQVVCSETHLFKESLRVTGPDLARKCAGKGVSVQYNLRPLPSSWNSHHLNSMVMVF